MSNKSREVPRVFAFLGSFALLLAVSAVSSRGMAADVDRIRERIQFMLVERHPDNRAERWLALGPEAPKVIMELIRSYPPASANQLRLIGALSHFKNDSDVARFLEEQVKGSENEVVQSSALRSYGISQGALGTEFVSKYLKDARPEMRIAAAETLARVHDPAADAQLNAYLENEKTPWVATRIKEVASAHYREGGDGRRSQGSVPASSAPSAVEAPHPAWEGEWKGFLIRQDSLTKGLKSDPVQVRVSLTFSRIELSGGRELPGITLARFFGKKAALEARMSPSAQPEPAIAELAERAGAWMIEIRMSRSGGVLILRKS